MSVPFFALCVCACLVTSWYLKLKMLFTYLMNVERSTNSCLPKCSEESKDMNMEDLLSVFLLDLHFQLLSRHMVREGRKWPLQCYE